MINILLIEYADHVDKMKDGMAKPVYASQITSEYKVFAELVTLDQHIMEKIASVMLDFMEIEINALLVILAVVNVLDLKLVNVLHVLIFH